VDKPTPWVCGNCRSINSDRTDRCYSCRAPKALAVDLRSTAPPIRLTADTPPEKQAEVAKRGGATYASSSGRATVVEGAIYIVTALSIFEAVWSALFVQILPDVDYSEALAEATVLLYLLGAEVLAWLLAFVAWGAWLSRVVANVPALGGGWPAVTPRAAFVNSVVPIYNLYGATAIVRDVLVRLSAPGAARIGLLTAWWLALFVAVLPSFGLIPGPTFVIRLAYTFIDNAIVALLVRLTGNQFAPGAVDAVLNVTFLILAAVLALRLVRHIEALQRSRLAIATAPASAPA
jgi:hypothetical protein